MKTEREFSVSHVFAAREQKASYKQKIMKKKKKNFVFFSHSPQLEQTNKISADDLFELKKFEEQGNNCVRKYKVVEL